MTSPIASLPLVNVQVRAGDVAGPLETWRHSFSHGGVNSHPLPERVRAGIARLEPRLVRIFIQEFFRLLPEKDRYDFSRLDPYMDALAATGATVVAAICIKPPVLYPTIDETIWRPNDPEQWHRLVKALVHRYSVQQRLVTHWEIGNEVDIGEHGGCPYKIRDADDYVEYYRMTVAAARDAWPNAKVGGPAMASIDNPPMEGFVRRCRDEGLPLDFISYHLYSDDPAEQGRRVRQAQGLVADFPEPRPEIMVTEFSPMFERISTADQAMAPRRAGCVAATIVEMLRAGLGGSFHYHLWDQTCYAEEFRTFYSEANLSTLMMRHWNEIPHRFGLFGVSQDVRPPYFVYWMLHRLGCDRLDASSDKTDVRVLAARGQDRWSAMVINYAPDETQDRVVSVHWDDLPPGRKALVTYRIDDRRRWDAAALEMIPLEQREVDTLGPYECQVYLPAGSVALVELVDVKGATS
ncbi:MAG: GH39 family glycosyl hydrolase [Planctomycetota bacterium]